MAAELPRPAGLVLAYVRAHLRRILEYRASFLVGVLAVMSRHVFGLLGLWVLFSHVGVLGDWQPYQVLYLYGYVALVHAVWHLCFANTLRVEYLVRDAGFDRYLVRPLPPIVQLLFNYFDDDALGDFVPAIACLWVASVKLDVRYTWETAALFLLGTAGGSLVHLGIQLLLSSWSFWFIKSRALLGLYGEVRRFADYPLTIFPVPLQWLFTLVVPIAFAGFYPAESLLSVTTLTHLAWLAFPVGITMASLGLLVWHVGLSRYQSAGS